VSSQAANPPERQATCLWRARPDRGRLASGGGFAARPASRLLFSNRWLTILTATNTAVHAKISVRPLISRTIDYSCERRRNPTPKRETSSAPIRKRISSAASCAWQICRRAPWIASAAMNTCCGGKRDRLWLRWSRCGTASDSRAVQPFHFRSGGASLVPCPKRSGDHSRGQRSTSICRTFATIFSALYRFLRHSRPLDEQFFELDGTANHFSSLTIYRSR
jgi:hypothetical protein